MVKSLRHTGLVVRDAEKVLSFYRDFLGFSIVRDAREEGPFVGHILGMPGVKVRTIKMLCDAEGMLELLCFDRTFPRPDKDDLIRPGFSHIALTVKDVDGLYGRLCGEGVAFIATPAISPDGRAKVAFCRDPEGNFLELVEEIK